jgi:serine/threonine protein kinase HipA of HipAB toxin-antitoxin module
MSPEGGNYHLLTLNGLLKNENCDAPFSAGYEDIARLIRQYSYQLIEDVSSYLLRCY